MKRIALLGGSFNPPHPGHFEMARLIHRALGVDKVWLLFSINTDKDPTAYAPLHDRIAMAEILAMHYKDVPVVLSTFQEDLGVHITADVLNALRNVYPDIEFIWVMGTDNLISFHTWENYADILRHFPCLILRREPYVEESLSSVTAKEFASLRQPDVETLLKEGHGWYVLPNDPFDMSSTRFRGDLQAGKRQFGGLLQEVADYAQQHGLYGIK